MPDLFHNPYHFVPLGSGSPPETVPLTEFSQKRPGEAAPERRHPRITHDRFVRGTHSGRLVCRVTVETPLICGNEQEQQANWSKLIKPFELKPGEPALPASALRGMLSALAEAVSHSALRVLHPALLSYRRGMADSRKLSAIGLVVRDTNGCLALRPLTLPTLDRDGGVYRFGSSVNGVPGDDQRFPGVFPEPCFRVYLGNGAYGAGQFRDTTGNALKNPRPGAGGVLAPMYGMQLVNPAPGWADPHGTCVAATGGWQRFPGERRQYLIGQRAAAAGLTPWDAAVPNPAHVRGFFRGLGLWTPAKREKARPRPKYHELFIPYTPAMESWPTLPILPSALERFRQLSKQRAQDDPEELQPYEPLGTRPGRRPGEPLDLEPGDLVYFLPTVGGRAVEEVSFSSLWRGRIEERNDVTGEAAAADVHRFVRDVSPELLPLSHGRELLTLAEQLFGSVMVLDPDKVAPGTPAFALASRLRVSHGTLHASPAGSAYQPASELCSPAQRQRVDGRMVPDIPLHNLASPKLPSPALYFKTRQGTPAYIRKSELAPSQHSLQGRKFYLRRKSAADVREQNLFVHPARLAAPDDRASIVRQHQSVKEFVRPETVFFFHLDFDNLSELELSLLAYVLQPSSQFRHQLGHGKPLGLGQVRTEILGLLEVNRHERYRGPLSAPRYQTVLVAGDPDEDWPKPLRRHVPAAVDRQPLAGRLAALWQNFRTWADQHRLSPVLGALERLGDPGAVRHPVHYPQAAETKGSPGQPPRPIFRDSAAFETELYQWFVQNDRIVDDRQTGQFLRPLVLPDGTLVASLPALDRDQRNQPPPPDLPEAPPQRPLDLANRVVPGCRALHKMTSTGARVRFEVPFRDRPLAGVLENAPLNIATLYPNGWVGPMLVRRVERAGNDWLCHLRPPPSSPSPH